MKRIGTRKTVRGPEAADCWVWLLRFATFGYHRFVPRFKHRRPVNAGEGKPTGRDYAHPLEQLSSGRLERYANGTT